MTYEDIFKNINAKVNLDPMLLTFKEKLLIERCKLINWGITSPWEIKDREKLLALWMKVCDA